MRAMLVTGAAFAAIDKRLPLLISELLTENTTLDDINKVISSVIPVLFRLKRNCLNYWKNNLVSIRLWIAVLLLQSRVCREMTVKTRPEETLKICSEMTELTQLGQGNISPFSCITLTQHFPFHLPFRGGSSPPQTTLSLFPTGSVHRVFSLTFHCFLRGWISSNNPGCAIPDGVKSASMTPAFI